MAVQGRAKSAAGIRRFEGVRPHLAAVQDPGPGEAILRLDGRSGRLSPCARPAGGSVTSAGGAPILTVEVTTISVPGGAETLISAAMLDGEGRPVQPACIVAVVVAEGVPPVPEQPMQLAAEAGQFELRLRTPVRPETFGWAVRARGALDGQRFDRVAAGAFQAQAGGRIDASAARVEQQRGDLQLTVPAEIRQAGAYCMYAELWGGPAGTRPIVFARQQFEDLPAGVRPLSLSFAGAIIRHTGIDGPYLVRNLQLQPIDGTARDEQEPIPSLPPTAAYRAADFL